MSRAGDPYRSSAGDIRGGGRWDAERFAMERDRARFEERESYLKPGGRTRERSVDEIYERRGPRGFEDERFESRRYYDEEPRIPRRERERDVTTIEKERYYSPSPPPRRAPPARPGFLRRQSSLDTFDRKPLNRFVEREEYGPPARYREEAPRPVPLTPIPLPRTRALPPPRRFADKEYYDEIEIAEDYYDDGYRGYPVREREREIIRKKRRSRSRESRMSRSVKSSVRSSSSSSSSSETTAVSVRSEFPKKGKTRMPARLVHKRAIIDLGYPFEEEGEIIIIQRALGRENIDEVIKLSEDYKANDRVIIDERRSEHGGSGTVIEERHEVFTIPPPPPPVIIEAPAPAPVEIIKETKVVEFENPHHHRHHSGGAIILDAGPREESTFVRREHDTYVERSDPIPVGPLALALAPERHHSRDEHAIRAEIRALEAEKEALRAEKRAEKELRKADHLRSGEMVVYEQDRVNLRPGEEVTLVKRERIEEDGGVRIVKDKKGRMSISVPKYYR